MQNNKFLGLCVLVSAIILSAAVVYHANAGRHPSIPQSSIGRYQFQPSTPPTMIRILDTTTGEVKTTHP